MLKIPGGMIETLIGKLQQPFLGQFVPTLRIGVVCCNQSGELWWMNQE
jgi:hypothetical protein